jgi:hypothetical protein
MKTIHPWSPLFRQETKNILQLVKFKAMMHPTLAWPQIFQKCIDDHPKTFIYFVGNQERFSDLFKMATLVPSK